MTTATYLKRQAQEATLRRRQSQDRMFAEWLNLRGHEAGENHTRSVDDLEDASRIDEVAEQYCSEPSVYPWMVMRKFEVLRHYLMLRAFQDGGDHTAIRMLGAIEADLVAAGLPLMTEPHHAG